MKIQVVGTYLNPDQRRQFYARKKNSRPASRLLKKIINSPLFYHNLGNEVNEGELETMFIVCEGCSMPLKLEPAKPFQFLYTVFADNARVGERYLCPVCAGKHAVQKC